MFFVRTASREDVPAVRNILAKTWHDTYDELLGEDKVNEFTGTWHSEARLTKQLTMPHSEFLVADNGEVVGGMAFATEKDKQIKLEQLYVHPDFQGQKVGFHLLIEIENSFHDATTISLEVYEKNAQAIGFYQKYGFKKVREISDCGESGFGIPAIIMEKQIIYADD